MGWLMRSTYESYGSGYERPQNIDPFGCSASAPEAYFEKPEQIESFPTALSFRLNAPGHSMPIMIILG